MAHQSPAPDAAGHVGETFRRRRQHFQVDLETVAGEIRVRPSFLAAIEEGRFAELPGATYAAGFVRTYAEYLDLDAEEMVRRFKDETASLARSAPLRFPSPIADGTVPRAALLLLGAVIVAVGYGAWYVLSTREAPVVEMVAPVPDRLASAPMPPSPAPEPAPRAAPSPPAPAPSATPSGTGEAATAGGTAPPPATGAGGGTNATPVPEAGHGAPAPATPPTGASPGTPSAPTGPDESAAAPTAPTAGRVVLRARADSWVSVRDSANNAVLIARVLRAGEEFAVPERPGLRLATGNAGGLVVLVDGEPLPPLGKEGTVRKGIVLEPEALRTASATAN